MPTIVEAREYYPDISTLPDSILVAKVLTLTAKLYNLHHSKSPVKSAEVTDTIESLRFYVSAIADRYQIYPPVKQRQSEYNEPLPVASYLNTRDLTALILSKSLRLHSVFHRTGAIHIDTVADLVGYLILLTARCNRSDTPV